MEVASLVMGIINRKKKFIHSSYFRISTPKKIEALKNIRIAQISSANGCENLALIS